MDGQPRRNPHPGGRLMGTKGGKQGGSFRRAFTDAERRAFRNNRAVLWHENRKWRRGVIIGGIHTDATGAQYVVVLNTDHATRNVDDGEQTRAYPGSVKKA